MAISPLRKRSSNPLHVWFYGGVFAVGGSNGAICSWTKFKRYVGENNARGVTIVWSQSKVFLVTVEMQERRTEINERLAIVSVSFDPQIFEHTHTK